MQPKAGLIIFSETRPDVYEARRHMADEEKTRLTAAMESEISWTVTEPVRSKNDLLKALARLRETGPDCIILHVPIFTAPNLVVLAARLSPVPVILVGNPRPDSHSTVAFLASRGGLDQAGLKYQAILADTGSALLRTELTAFCQAAAAYNRMRGLTFGVFGGRCLGITTGTADPAQWMREFGIDVQHIDQSEITRVAELQDDNEVTLHTSWLLSRLGKVEYDGERLTPSTLRKQVKSYLATRSLIRSLDLDFIGIKCQTELSDHYALQCLNCALTNDPYDADGDKEPVPCACEADQDGALTMQMLKLISGGQPSALLDVRQVPEKGPVILPNCGSIPTWFAARDDDPRVNLSRVHLVPHVFGKAGGAAVQFVCSEGPVTLARLSRQDGRYRMVIVRGTLRSMPREELAKTTWAFPHAFLEGNFSRPALFEALKTNHLHMTAGDHTDALEYLCHLYGLEYVMFNE